MIKANMVCMGFKPVAAGWYAQTKTWSYGGRPTCSDCFLNKWACPDLFSFIFSHFKQINVKNIKSIQYTAPGFEPTTS